MASVALVTDSTAYLPPEIVEQYGITVVPLYVRFGEEVFLDGVDMTPEQFYARLSTSKVMPATSQPSPGDFDKAYRRLVEEGASAILSIHISSKLSGTVSSALLAREEFDIPIHVVDSLSTSMGQGYMVLEAVRSLQAGKSVEEIVRSLEALRDNVHLLFVVDTLEFLHRGGRIGGAQAFLGSLLNLKPLLVLREGKVEALERVRTKKRAVQRMLDIVAEEVANLPVRTAVIHAAAAKEAETLRQKVQDRLDSRELHISEMSPVIGTHTGPGAVGMIAYPVVEE